MVVASTLLLRDGSAFGAKMEPFLPVIFESKGRGTYKLRIVRQHTDYLRAKNEKEELVSGDDLRTNESE